MIAPDSVGSVSDAFPGNGPGDGIVVVGSFKWAEAVLACINRLYRIIAAALSTAQRRNMGQLSKTSELTGVTVVGPSPPSGWAKGIENGSNSHEGLSRK